MAVCHETDRWPSERTCGKPPFDQISPCATWPLSPGAETLRRIGLVTTERPPYLPRTATYGITVTGHGDAGAGQGESKSLDFGRELWREECREE